MRKNLSPIILSSACFGIGFVLCILLRFQRHIWTDKDSQSNLPNPATQRDVATLGPSDPANTVDKSKQEESFGKLASYSSLTRIITYLEGAKLKDKSVEIFLSKLHLMEDGRLRDCLSHGYLASIAETDPHGAWELYMTGKFGESDHAVNSIVSKLVETSPETVAGEFLSSGGRYLSHLSSAWLARDPSSASEWLLKKTTSIGNTKILTEALHTGKISPTDLVGASRKANAIPSNQILAAMFENSLPDPTQLTSLFDWVNTLPKYHQSFVEQLAYAQSSKSLNFQDAYRVATELPSMPSTYKLLQKWAEGQDRATREQAYAKFMSMPRSIDVDPTRMKELLLSQK